MPPQVLVGLLALTWAAPTPYPHDNLLDSATSEYVDLHVEGPDRLRPGLPWHVSLSYTFHGGNVKTSQFNISVRVGRHDVLTISADDYDENLPISEWNDHEHLKILHRNMTMAGYPSAGLLVIEVLDGRFTGSDQNIWLFSIINSASGRTQARRYLDLSLFSTTPGEDKTLLTCSAAPVDARIPCIDASATADQCIAAGCCFDTTRDPQHPLHPACFRKDVNECMQNSTLCSPFGRCRDTIRGFQCSCDEDHHGRLCQYSRDQVCLPNLCNGGDCIETGNGRYRCFCQRGYVGEHCEEDFDECAHNKSLCLPHGTCINVQGTYECRCSSLHYGKDCSQKYTVDNPCNTARCYHGDCVRASLRNHTCACYQGFTGERCEQDLQECQSNQTLCLPFGQCKDMFGRFECHCKDRHFGKFCEYEFVKRVAGPDSFNLITSEGSGDEYCMNGGLWGRHVKLNTTHCVCLHGYYGERCELMTPQDSTQRVMKQTKRRENLITLTPTSGSAATLSMKATTSLVKWNTTNDTIPHLAGRNKGLQTEREKLPNKKGTREKTGKSEFGWSSIISILAIIVGCVVLTMFFIKFGCRTARSVTRSHRKKEGSRSQQQHTSAQLQATRDASPPRIPPGIHARSPGHAILQDPGNDDDQHRSRLYNSNASHHHKSVQFAPVNPLARPLSYAAYR